MNELTSMYVPVAFDVACDHWSVMVGAVAVVVIYPANLIELFAVVIVITDEEDPTMFPPKFMPDVPKPPV